MKEEQQCQNCKGEFEVTQDDEMFYKKIDVPPSNYCSTCKLQRRMMFRNERTLYKRQNNAPSREGEQIISIHREGVPYTIYDDRTWWSDAWDPMEYGDTFNFSEPFFNQYKKLYRRIPLINLSITNMVNCSYCNVSEGDKGSYMISASNKNEDCLYSNRVASDKQSSDLYIATKNELCYELVSCSSNFKVRWAEYSYECRDSAFLYNCKSCSDCIGCVNLRNKSYCIFNEQLDRETYARRKEELRLTTYSGMKKVRETFRGIIGKSIHRYANNVRAIDSTGDNLENTNNVKDSFDIFDAEHSKNIVWGGYGFRDARDAGPGVGVKSELIYDAFDTALEVSRAMWTSVVYHSFDVRYSINCHSCSHIFGCYGLRSKEYCILNRQYSKEEYEALIPKIISHMNTMPYVDGKNRVFAYGDFFPYDLSPFAYNETVAQEYFPLTREEAIKKGFTWYDRADRKYTTTLKNENIPDDIRDVTDSILEETMECENKGAEVSQCTSAFRVVRQELSFYRQLQIPIPRYCYNCRHFNRLKLRNPMKLWRRTCACGGRKSQSSNNKSQYENTATHEHGDKPCQNEFETSYSPESPAIVYCEQCYQQEVV